MELLSGSTIKELVFSGTIICWKGNMEEAICYTMLGKGILYSRYKVDTVLINLQFYTHKESFIISNFVADELFRVDSKVTHLWFLNFSIPLFSEDMLANFRINSITGGYIFQNAQDCSTLFEAENNVRHKNRNMTFYHGKIVTNQKPMEEYKPPVPKYVLEIDWK